MIIPKCSIAVFFFFLKGLNTDELKVDGSSTGFYAAMG